MFSRIESALARTLTEQEKGFIRAGIDYLINPLDDKFEYLKQKETVRLKFSAISTEILQITLGGESQISQITLTNQSGIITPTVVTDLTSIKVNANEAAPQVMSHFAHLTAQRKFIIFFGGGVRMTLTPDDLMKTTHKCIETLITNLDGTFAVLTDGYKGNDIATGYPATRAPHDISQYFESVRIPRYMIVPQCGKDVCHQSVHAKDFYGNNWGEEAPALAEVANAFLYMAPFNLITELEIILALKQNKPVVIIDIHQEDKIMHHVVAKCGYVYPEGGVYSYQSPEAAAHFLLCRLSEASIGAHMQSRNENTPPSFSKQLTQISPVKSPMQFDRLTNQWDHKIGVTGFRKNLASLLSDERKTQSDLSASDHKTKNFSMVFEF